MHHAYTWFDDPAASYIVFGDITRKGDKLAVGEDGFAATRMPRLRDCDLKARHKEKVLLGRTWLNPSRRSAVRVTT